VFRMFYNNATALPGVTTGKAANEEDDHESEKFQG
jgi:hypothetical protein